MRYKVLVLVSFLNEMCVLLFFIKRLDSFGCLLKSDIKTVVFGGECFHKSHFGV